MKLLILLSGLMLISATTTFYSGYLYQTTNDKFYSLKYSKLNKNHGDTFITIYKVNHPIKNYHYYNVTAIHYKSENRIEVVSEDATGALLSGTNKEIFEYDPDSVSLKPFGFDGNWRIIGGTRVPHQLMLKFVSSKYENVKVCEFLFSYDSYGSYFFKLDK